MEKKILILLIFTAFAAIYVNAQDVVIKRNGDEIEAKVLEIGINEIKYKKFDNETGPTYTVSKSEIFMIKYANGSKDVFTEISKTTPVDTNTQYTENIENTSKEIAPSELTYSFWYGVQLDGKTLRKNEIRDLYKYNPEALKQYNNGRILDVISNIFAFSAGWAFGTALVLDDEDWAGIGILFVIASTPFAITGNAKIKSSTKIYNSGLNNYKMSYNFSYGISPSGFKMVFNF